MNAAVHHCCLSSFIGPVESFKDQLNLLAAVYRLIDGAEFSKYLRLNRSAIHSNQVRRNRWTKICCSNNRGHWFDAHLRVCGEFLPELSKKKITQIPTFFWFDRPGPLAGALDTQKNVFLTDCIGRSPLCQLILISHESFHFLGLKKKSQPVHSFDNTPTGYHCRAVSAEVFLFLGPTTCRCVPPGVARVVQAAEQHFEKRNKKNVFGHFVGDCAFVG